MHLYLAISTAFGLAFLGFSYVLPRLATFDIYTPEERRDIWRFLRTALRFVLKSAIDVHFWTSPAKAARASVDSKVLEKERRWLFEVSEALSKATLPILHYIALVLRHNSGVILQRRLLSERKLPMSYVTFRTQRLLIFRVLLNLFRQNAVHLYDSLCRLTLAGIHNGDYHLADPGFGSVFLMVKSSWSAIHRSGAEGHAICEARKRFALDLSRLLSSADRNFSPVDVSELITRWSRMTVDLNDCHLYMLLACVDMHLRYITKVFRGSDAALKGHTRRLLRIWADALVNLDLQRQYACAVRLTTDLRPIVIHKNLVGQRESAHLGLQDQA